VAIPTHLDALALGVKTGAVSKADLAAPWTSSVLSPSTTAPGPTGRSWPASPPHPSMAKPCQTVARGRSNAETPGSVPKNENPSPHPMGAGEGVGKG
jgi:hypothetical protein